MFSCFFQTNSYCNCISPPNASTYNYINGYLLYFMKCSISNIYYDSLVTSQILCLQFSTNLYNMQCKQVMSCFMKKQGLWICWNFKFHISHFYYRRITNHFFAFFTMIDVVPRWYLTSPLWWFSLNLAKCHSITNWSNNINTITSHRDNPIHLHTW